MSEECNPYKELEQHDVGYEPAHEYHKVWHIFTFYLNAFIKKDGTDITVDKTTWLSTCFGPVYHCLIKKNALKGRQHKLAIKS